MFSCPRQPTQNTNNNQPLFGSALDDDDGATTTTETTTMMVTARLATGYNDDGDVNGGGAMGNGIP
jgi:hypothetical protein